jgi:hypothetical protein
VIVFGWGHASCSYKMMRVNNRGGVNTFKYSQIHMWVTSMRFQVFGTGFMEGNFKNLVKWSEQKCCVSIEDMQENTLELRRKRCLVTVPCKPFMNLGLPNPNMPPSPLMGFPFKIHCSKMTTSTKYDKIEFFPFASMARHCLIVIN